MYEYVQAVTDGNAKDDGSKAKGHKGHIAFDPVNAGKGEQGSVNYGNHLLPHKPEGVETQDHYHKNHQEGEAHRPH